MDLLVEVFGGLDDCFFDDFWCEGESFTGCLERRERFESAMALSGVRILPFVT